MLREIYAAAMATTWAIRDAALMDLLAQSDMSVTVEGRQRRKLPRVDGMVAILPLHGVISQRSSIWQDVFGGTATESFGAAFQRAMSEDRIKAVVLDVDSPGGTVSGVIDLAQMIHDGSQKKEVAAVANSQMASAAYWLASQVGGGRQRLAAAPGSDVGSIGVFRMHEDISGMLEEQGVAVTMIAVPRFKTEANPFQPLTKQALAHHTQQVEASYEQFVADVARGRGVAKSVVKQGYGEGRVFHASQAAEMGLVDRVASLDRLMQELGSGSKSEISRQESSRVAQELCHAWKTGESGVMPNMDLQARKDRMRLLVKT